jgi:cytochrome c oxidase subunit 3
MTSSRTIDVSSLPAYSLSASAPLWLGQVLLAVIEGSMFLMLIAMYFYLRLSVDMWPPPGTQLPHLNYVTWAMVPLALSCVGSWWASEGAKKNSRRDMLVGLAANLALGAVYMALRFAQVGTLNFIWSTDVHGSIFWTILFLHAFDAVADVIFTLVLFVIIASGRYGERQRLGVHVDSVVWYFIAAIWVPLYVVLYWGPRIVGAP